MEATVRDIIGQLVNEFQTIQGHNEGMSDEYQALAEIVQR